MKLWFFSFCKDSPLILNFSKLKLILITVWTGSKFSPLFNKLIISLFCWSPFLNLGTFDKFRLFPSTGWKSKTKSFCHIGLHRKCNKRKSWRRKWTWDRYFRKARSHWSVVQPGNRSYITEKLPESSREMLVSKRVENEEAEYFWCLMHFEIYEYYARN